MVRLLMFLFVFTSTAQAKSLFNEDSQASYPGIRYYSAFLKKYVRSDGVLYAKAVKDLPKLKAYFKRFKKSAPPEFDKSRDALAYHINLYNLAVLIAVLERYPVKSVLKEDQGQFFKLKFSFRGKQISLDDLENTIIRPKFKEPLIHFALNCASISCPPLRREVYTNKKLRSQLKSQANSYLKKKAFLSYDAKKNEITIVELFKWYAVDFPDLVQFLNKYSPYKKIKPGASIKYSRYNWGLNEKK